MEVKIDSELFFNRLTHIHNDWLANKGVWADSDAVCFPMGANNAEESNYTKSAALHLYLLGYEFPDTIIIMLQNTFYIMSTTKKLAYIEAVVKEKPDSPFKFHFITKSKDEAMNKEGFNTIIAAIKKSGTRLGTILKADFKGTFIPSWVQATETAAFELADISPAIGKAIAVKDQNEIVNIPLPIIQPPFLLFFIYV